HRGAHRAADRAGRARLGCLRAADAVGHSGGARAPGFLGGLAGERGTPGGHRWIDHLVRTDPNPEMSTPLILALLAFAAAFLFALIVGGWREAIEAAWPKNAVATEGPQVARVSLLVPARNAARTLTALLQDLHAQQWPKEALEVIVVDDGSEDGTAEQVREMGKRWPGLVLLKAEGKGKKDAISQGVRRAQGEWVLLTDADARCGPLRV